MADYYPLIARAIAGLDPSAPGESRRALYERARAALIAQLRGVQPPLSESEITRERLAHFKCPHTFTFVAELPKTATGKIQKFVLRGRRAAIAAQ